jgi:hypothetical protein
MASTAFAAYKDALDDACTFLRSFTLGRQGFTLQDGRAGIARVETQCDLLTKLFASGPDAKQAATVVASARTRVAAAQARLDLLGKKR